MQKAVNKNIGILFFLILFTSLGFSQNSASATFTASVNIVEPIEIRTTSNMNFADVDARKGGKVVLSPNDTRTSIGDVLLKSSAGVSAARFEVYGHDEFSYDIDVPQGEYLLSNGENAITIKDFIYETSSDHLKNGKQVIKLGATLEINANQNPGKYISQEALQVTVAYN